MLHIYYGIQSLNIKSISNIILSSTSYALLHIYYGIQSFNIKSILNIILSSPSPLHAVTLDSSSYSSQDQLSTAHDNYSLPNTYHMVTLVNVGIFKLKLFHVTSSTPLSEPTSYKQAMQSPEWLLATKTGYATLMSNRTWSLTPLPSDTTVVGCKWVFKRKFYADIHFNDTRHVF